MDSGETTDLQDETPFDPESDQESEMEDSGETAVAVAEPPPVQPPPPQAISNGHAPAAGPTIQTQEVITHAPRPYVPPAPVVRRSAPAKKVDKNQTAREKVERICNLPESMDWEFRIHRLPQGMLLGNGEPVKTGHLESVETMPFDSLKDCIARLWGGGEYKLIPCAKNDHSPVTNFPEAQVVFLSIRTDDYPPKNNRGATLDEPAIAIEAQDETVKEYRRQAEIDMEATRARKAELRRQKEEYEIRKQQFELRKLERELQEPAVKATDGVIEMRLMEMRQASEKALAEARAASEKAIEEMRRQQEKDRETAAARAKEDRDAADRKFDAMLNKMGEITTKIAEIANKPAPMPLAAPVDTTPELIKGIGSMLQALAPKQDNTSQIELAKMAQSQNEKFFELMVRLTAKDNTQQNALMTELIKGRDSGNKQSSIQEIMSILEYGRKLQDHTIKMVQGTAEEPAPGEGWNPKIGVLGNMAQQFFGIIKEAVKSAASSPHAQQMLMNLFNKTNPSEQEQLAAAQELERRQIAQGIQPQAQLPVPQAGIQGMPQQRPLVTPAPQMPQVPGMAIPMRTANTPRPPQSQAPRQTVMQQQPRPPMAQVQPQAPGVNVQQRVQPGPQPMPPLKPAVPVAPQPQSPPATAPENGAPPQPTPTAAPPVAVKPTPDAEEAAAKAAASEMEAEVTGVSEVDITELGATTPPSAPAVPMETQGASIPHPPLPVTPVAGHVPAPPVPAQPPSDEASMRLRERVTEAMAEALQNVTDEIEEHTWPGQAIGQWNGKFKVHLRQQPDVQQAARIIGMWCEPAVWAALMHALETSTAEPPQWNAFFEGIRVVLTPTQQQ